MGYILNFSFYSPRNQHDIDLNNLRSAARRCGIEMEIIHQQQFRNPQRLGARAIQSQIQFKSNDKNLLQRFGDSITLI